MFKKILIVLYVFISITVDCKSFQEIDTTSYNAFIFTSIDDLNSCKTSLISSQISYFKGRDIIPNIVIKNIREQQIEKAYDYCKEFYKECNILFDTNSYFSKKLNPKNEKEIVVTKNNFEILSYLDNEIVPDTLNYKSNVSSFQIGKKLNFKEDFPMSYHNIEYNNFTKKIILNDNFQNQIYILDEKSADIVKIIPYALKLDFIKEKVSDSLFQIIKSKEMNKSKSRCFLNSDSSISLVLHLLKDTSFVDNRLSGKYGYYLYDFNNNSIEEILSADHYYLYTKNCLLYDKSIYSGCYDTHYHHTRHEEVKDNSAAIIKIDGKNAVPIFSLSDFEKITGCIYSYSFLPKIIFDDNNRIVVFNILNSLLMSFDPNINSPKNSIISFKIHGVLLDLFKSLSQIDKFGVYEHKPFKYPSNIYSTSIKCYKGNSYISLFAQNEDKIIDKLYIQKYNNRGEFVFEKNIVCPEKKNDQLKSFKILSISKTYILCLFEWQNDFLELTRIPFSELK